MDVFDLMAKIGVDTDEYDKGLDDAGTRGKSIASKIGAGIKAGVAVGTAALGAAATGVAAITKQAVAAYSEQEQLAGGVQKIFADMDTSVIMQDAAEAYKTLGLSANQYLAKINDVGATFASTMGAEAGYETAKRGLQAISDYATGTGKNVDTLSEKFTMITRATSSYQSIADQFSGILPATSAAFLEQAQSAGYLEDSYKKLTEVPIEEYQAAVAQMLEQGVANLNLTGNTAAEAADTLSGSAGMLKAAWQNLVAGFADPNADIGLLMQNMVASASASIDNLVPTIQQAMSGISAALVDQAPELINTFIDSITTLGPDLIDAATELVLAIADTFSTPESIEKLVQAGVDMVLKLAEGLSETLPVLIPAVINAIITIVETLTNPDNLMMLLDAAIEIILALAEGLINAMPQLIEKAPEIIYNLVVAIIKAAPKLLQASLELILTLVRGIVESFGKIIEVGGQIVEKVKNGFSQKVQDAKNWGRDMIQNFIDGILAKWNDLKQSVSNVAQTVKDYLGFSEPSKGPLSNFHTFAPDMMQLYAKGIRDNEYVVAEQLNKSLNLEDGIIKYSGSGVTSGYSANNEVVARIEAILSDFLPKLNQNIYLDTGALVGGTAEMYNAEIGMLNVRGSKR